MSLLPKCFKFAIFSEDLLAAMILFCILLMKHKHILTYLCLYF